MGALRYTVTIESDTPPKLYLGENIAGGTVVALSAEPKPKLVDVSWLLQRYPLTRTTIINRLAGHNQGSDGKHLYCPDTAHAILTAAPKKRGRVRKE